MGHLAHCLKERGNRINWRVGLLYMKSTLLNEVSFSCVCMSMCVPTVQSSHWRNWKDVFSLSQKNTESLSDQMLFIILRCLSLGIKLTENTEHKTLGLDGEPKYFAWCPSLKISYLLGLWVGHKLNVNTGLFFCLCIPSVEHWISFSSPPLP